MPAERSLLRRLRGVALCVTLASGISTGAVALAPAPASAQTFGEAVVAKAATYYGTPYVYGGTQPGGFDCSGFTQYVFGSFGISLPRTAQDQYGAVAHVPYGQQQPGDLIFFYSGGSIYHVGIYAGGGNIWAATHTGDIVREEAIYSSAFLVGRVTGGGAPAAPAVPGAIGQHWQALGGAAGFLGQPLGAEHGVTGGRAVDFQGGSIYWSAATGAWSVRGGIQGDYLAVGASTLGLPVTDELGWADGVGRFNNFSNHASVFWSPWTGGHAVMGAIRDEWAAKGWTRGPGYPTTDESGTPDGVGRYNHFSNGASIYWSPSTGAHLVRGAVRAAWFASGAESGPAGYPTSDEQVTPDGVGAYNDFSKGASIYWSPATGAHVLSGALRDSYRANGASTGGLGFPVDDQHAIAGGQAVDFQGGSIVWSASTGAASVIRKP